MTNLNQAIKDGQNTQGLQEVADRLNGTLRQLLGEDNASEAERASAQLSENVKVRKGLKDQNYLLKKWGLGFLGNVSNTQVHYCDVNMLACIQLLKYNYC